jgi:hypothetical protein
MDRVGISMTILSLSIIFPPGYPCVTVRISHQPLQRVCDTKPSIPEPSHYHLTEHFQDSGCFHLLIKGCLPILTKPPRTLRVRTRNHG